MQTDWTKLQSQAIDLLRLPMAVAVVMLHYGMTVIEDATGALRVLCIIFEEGVFRLAVPWFFLVSGYLFFRNLQEWDWTIWIGKIRRRIRTLMIPYILWIIIAFFAFWAYDAIQGGRTTIVEQFIKDGGIRMFWGTNGRFPISVRSAPLNSALWFVRDLIYYTLATPLIYLFITTTKRYGVWIVSAVFLFARGIMPEGFVFFLLGSFFQLDRKNMCEWAWPRRLALCCSALFLLIVFYCLNVNGVDYWGRFIKNCFLFVGVGTVFCVAVWVLRRWKMKVNPLFVRSSFFVFATHEILLLRAAAIPLVYQLLPKNGQIWDILRFFLTPTVAVSFCLFVFCIIGLFSPRTVNILIGSRNYARRG